MPMKKIVVFLTVSLMLFSCNSRTSQRNSEENEESEIIIVDTHESDSIRMWKELAEESIERERRDETIIKELLPRARKMIENKSYNGSDSEDAFSRYLKECEVEGSENVVKSTMESMYEAYNKKQYKAVITYSDIIESERIKVQSFIEN